jgi:hypothetical protein
MRCTEVTDTANREATIVDDMEIAGDALASGDLAHRRDGDAVGKFSAAQARGENNLVKISAARK